MAHYKGAAKEAGRALNLIKKRQKEQQELEVRKRKIEEELAIGNIHNKFAAHYDAVEQKLKSDTIGLVTLDQMKAKQEDVVKARERQIAVNHGEAHLQVAKGKSRKSRGREAKQRSALSFDMDEYDDDGDDDDDDDDDDNESDEEEEEEEKKEDDIKYNSVPPPPIPSVSEQDEDDFSLTAELQATMKEEQQMKKRRLGKNPDVDTSFLPDRDREEADAKLREELRQEWVAKQERIKNEEIDITYSYWDGSGHRRSVRMRKGNTMNQFLHRCLEQLRCEFHELKTASVDQLMYVKEDLIIPHHNSFYDFIVTKARGKSGPLFNFDVHDDVRIISDATIEKDESHAGKVCLRSWYERNKHIFPASRWEPYDPEKKWDKYTVSDKESAKIIVK